MRKLLIFLAALLLLCSCGSRSKDGPAQEAEGVTPVGAPVLGSVLDDGAAPPTGAEPGLNDGASPPTGAAPGAKDGASPLTGAEAGQGAGQGAGLGAAQAPDPEPEPESDPDPEPTQEELESAYLDSLIDGMSIEEQVSQMFILNLGARHTAPSEDLGVFVSESGAGGYILFGGNITTVGGTRALTDAINESSAVAPFICIDEEGGTVSRLRSAGLPGYAAQPSARDVGAGGNAQDAYLAGEAIGAALSSIGVNVDFAPVADVLTNPRNTAIGSRSYGSDPEAVADFAAAFQAGLHSCGIMSAPKHFPGHGNTASDSHKGRTVIASSPEHLAAVEYVPFARLIGEGAQFIMTGHLLVPSVEPGGLPATLSEYFITEVLRGELGFGGIVVTDSMSMGAITQEHSSADAAILAVMAGVDMILLPEDYGEAASGIIRAVGDGTITTGRIRESLTRIMRTKLKMGVIAISN